MAAGTFIFLDSAKLLIMGGAFHLSATHVVGLVHSASVGALDIDTSTQASMTALTLSGDVIYKTQGAISVITKTAAGVLKYDMSDINMTASSGVTLSAKWAVVLSPMQISGTVATVTSSFVPIGFFELSVGSEVVASQINITWPAAGVFETSDNV